MKDDNQLRFLAYMLAAAGAALIGFAVIYGMRTKATKAHTLSRQAREAYNSADSQPALASLQYRAYTAAFGPARAGLDL